MRLIFMIALASLGAARMQAESPAALSIRTYAGLSITGTVGTVYTVQFTTNLSQPDWRSAGIVQLPTSPYLWVDTTTPVAEHRNYRAIEGPTNLVWIPPGTFTMGSPSNEVERQAAEGPQTVVTLTRGFFMGKYEVTQREYLEITGSNPSTTTNELRRPVDTVYWPEATNYCARLSEREQTAGRLPANWRYRLPTEAEWEYACRAGTTTAFHYGPALLSGMANFNGGLEYESSVGTTNNPVGIFLEMKTIVGSYQPNGWGLYDMHGNVYEWCLDGWSDRLPGGRVVDPYVPSSDSFHIYRGGHYYGAASLCRSSYRFHYTPVDGIVYFGFRIVLAPLGP